jgi:hypothetical protein
VENEKSFFQDLYKALEAEETHDHTNPTRGSEDLFMATDPPGDGGGQKSRPGGLYIHGFPYGLVYPRRPLRLLSLGPPYTIS